MNQAIREIFDLNVASSIDILRISLKRRTCDIRKYHNIFIALKTFDKPDIKGFRTVMKPVLHRSS